MTAKQDALYWREWGALSRRCQAEGWTVPDRHELHARALGADASHKNFTNEQFDRVLAIFRSYSQAENVNAQLRQIAQPTRRRTVKLSEIRRCLALYLDDVDAYIAHLCLDKFRTPDPDDLSDQRPPARMGRFGEWQPPSQVEQLIMTLSRALNGKDGYRKQAGHTLHDMLLQAGLPCDCRACATGGSARVASQDATQREAARPEAVPAGDADPEW